MTANSARTLRILLAAYENGWNNAIDATIRAKHETINPMKEIRKLLEDFRDEEEGTVTEPDKTPATSEPIQGADK